MGFGDVLKGIGKAVTAATGNPLIEAAIQMVPGGGPALGL